MEEQGKRVLLAVMAAFVVMIGWQMLFPPEQPEKKPEQPEQTEQSGQSGNTNSGAAVAPGPGGKVDTAGTRDGKDPSSTEPAEPAPPPVAPRGEEQRFTFEFERFRAKFSSYGGRLVSWELLGSKYLDYQTGDGAQINLVRTPAEKEQWWPFAIGFADSDLIPAETEWHGEKVNDTEMAFVWTLTGDSGPLLKVTKRFVFFPDDFLVKFTVEVKNLALDKREFALQVSLFGYQDPNEDTEGGWTSLDSAWRSACHINGDIATTAFQSLEKAPKLRPNGRIRWVGFLHSYFLTVLAPRLEKGDDVECNAYSLEGLRGGMRTDLVFEGVELGPDDPPLSREMWAYMGPKYLDKLESLRNDIGFDPAFDDAVDMGWFTIIARPLLWLLQFLQSFLINWGLAIIALTIMVKLVTLPWTVKSMKSMKAMAKLKPKIEVLQKKYKDDKQRQQAELMNLYKAHGVNPLLGCLPMLLQMPIWIALYRMLMAAAELYQAPFIPGWIDNLTSEDPYYILPIALTGMMFLQAKLSPTQPDSTQQKIMMYGLPMMFGVFSLFFPAGLTLYMFTNTVLTAAHHLWMNRNDRDDDKNDGGPANQGQAGKRPGASKPSGKRPAGKPADDESADRDEGGESESSDGGAESVETPAATQPARRSSSKSRSRGNKKKKSAKRKRGGKS